MIKYIVFSTQHNITAYYTSALEGKKNGQLLWNNCIIADLCLLAATEATRKCSWSIQLQKSITAKINLFWDYYTHITWIWGPKIRFLHMLSAQWHSLGNQTSNDRNASILENDMEKCLSFFTHLSKQLLNIRKTSTRVLKFSGLNHFSRLLAWNFQVWVSSINITAKRHNIFTY